MGNKGPRNHKESEKKTVVRILDRVVRTTYFKVKENCDMIFQNCSYVSY